MKFDTQFECMNKECNTVVIYKSGCLDGIRCPRCDGPVFPAPYRPLQKVTEDALYIRKEIIIRCKKHCFDLTPEQVETVLEIYKSKPKISLEREVKQTGVDKFGWATFDYADVDDTNN